MSDTCKRTMLMSASNPDSGFGCSCKVCSPIGKKTSNWRAFRRIVKRRERQGWKAALIREERRG